MGFLGGLGLALLMMAGYSIGRVLPGKKRQVTAELFDGVAIVTLWVLALTTHFTEDILSYLQWIGVGIIVGTLITLFIRSSLTPAVISTPDLSGKKFFGKIWETWKAFAFRMGNFQGRLILLIFYFTIFAPFGIINTLFRDALNLKNTSGTSFWFPLGAQENDLEEARRQF